MIVYCNCIQTFADANNIYYLFSINYYLICLSFVVDDSFDNDVPLAVDELGFTGTVGDDA